MSTAVIDWSKAPEWASWAFMTKSCVWYWSRQEPIWDDANGDWGTRDQVEKMVDQPSSLGVDFEESLQSRYLLGRWRRHRVTKNPSQQAKSKHPHYHKPTNGAETVDVYWVLNAWQVDCHATGHAIKKLLNAGQRGVKPAKQDLEEAIDSIKRAIELLE